MTRQSLSWTRTWLSPAQERAQHYLRQVPDFFRLLDRYMDRPGVRYAAYAASLGLFLLCITTAFGILTQIVFALLLWLLAVSIHRIPGRVGTLLLLVLSATVSTRYLWWRVTDTLNWDETFDLLWGLLLLLAEVYTWLILILGFVQTSWPLHRRPTPLPEDTALWPSVDIFIPTYNEPLKVVKPTVFAALGMDWPRDKLNVYILDDGRREEFREFAAAAGVGYLTRNDNAHAKAGNINRALTHTHGEFIAIFDCDHIPTRSFLQVTMGGFLADPKLALVQTPHHFFSPDPFERNLGMFRRMPNEGELFYGLIQDGNDLWNAAFFCGSCAVLRRGPLQEVGGIAVETVTEDAHTALKLHRRGYNSAYLRITQAAGLATESLSAHIGQRIRWARGMAQIFRLDNPLLGPGLNWMQRMCYSNAMMHFLNGIPRLIFLTSPLAFLLFHAYIIYAPALAVALYVLPHMAHASLTNSRMQGGFRFSFWAEVYETVLAWYIARPTVVALINPHKGKFNVTAKGGLVNSTYFDWAISMPYLVLLILNLVGFSTGLWMLWQGNSEETMTIVLNMFWTVYNLLVLGAAVAVAAETRQVRLSHRVPRQLPATVRLPGGQLIQAQTIDFSEGGASLRLPIDMPLQKNTQIMVFMRRGEEEFAFPALVVRAVNMQIRLQWQGLDATQEAALVQCTFGRADAWLDWSDDRPYDQPMSSLKEVIFFGIQGYERMIRHFAEAIGEPRHLQSTIRWIRDILPRPARPLPTDSLSHRGEGGTSTRSEPLGRRGHPPAQNPVTTFTAPAAEPGFRGAGGAA